MEGGQERKTYCIYYTFKKKTKILSYSTKNNTTKTIMGTWPSFLALPRDDANSGIYSKINSSPHVCPSLVRTFILCIYGACLRNLLSNLLDKTHLNRSKTYNLVFSERKYRIREVLVHTLQT